MTPKKTTPRPASGSAPATPTVPLQDITIEWSRPALFHGEEGESRVTITGEQLAVVLRWLALTTPGNVVHWFGDPAGVALQLTGYGEMCKVMAVSEFQLVPVDMHAVLSTLGDALGDLVHRINARDDLARTLKTATVTVAAGQTTGGHP